MPRRIAISLTIMLLLILACNLPARAIQPTPDDLGTRVAQTLTQMASQQSYPSQPPPTPSTPESPTPSFTPSVTPFATPSPTVTSGEDPRQALGNPIYIDTLDSGRAFGLEGKVYEDENTLIRIQDGSMVLTSKFATGYHGWRTGGRKIKNGYVEALVRVSDCAGLDTYGLVIRSPDYIRGYWFTLTCDGHYGFGYWDGEKYVNLISQSDDKGAINVGSNQTNRLGIMAQGDTFKLYVNGRLLDEVSSNVLPDEGYCGMVIAAHNTPGFTVYLDEIDYWESQ